MANTSRRAILAGASVLAAAASVPISACAAVPSHGAISDPDPIFAAIERHKIAFRLSQEAGRVASVTVDAKWSPEYDEALCRANKAADEDAEADAAQAARKLTTIQPTSVAGVLALIRHVEAFNDGAYYLAPKDGSTINDWRSRPMHWPESADEDEIDLFGYFVLANVRRALEAMAVQA